MICKYHHKLYLLEKYFYCIFAKKNVSLFLLETLLLEKNGKNIFFVNILKCSVNIVYHANYLYLIQKEEKINVKIVK